MHKDIAVIIMTHLDERDFGSLLVVSKFWWRVSKQIPQHYIQYRSRLLDFLQEAFTQDDRRLVKQFITEFRAQFFAPPVLGQSRAHRLLVNVYLNTHRAINLKLSKLADVHFAFLYEIGDISYPCQSFLYVMNKTGIGSSHVNGSKDEQMTARVKESILKIYAKQLPVALELNEVRYLIVWYLRRILVPASTNMPLFSYETPFRLTKIKLYEMARYLNKGRSLHFEELIALVHSSSEDAPQNALLCMGSGLQRISVEVFCLASLNAVKEIDQEISQLIHHIGFRSKQKNLTIFKNANGQDFRLKNNYVFMQLTELLNYRTTILRNAAEYDMKEIREVYNQCEAYAAVITGKLRKVQSFISNIFIKRYMDSNDFLVKNRDADIPPCQQYIEPFSLRP